MHIKLDGISSMCNTTYSDFDGLKMKTATGKGYEERAQEPVGTAGLTAQVPPLRQWLQTNMKQL
jgi:hypothetical protein